jgi:SET domain-containing protein
MLLVPTKLLPSSIHGIGVFLLAPVKKGQLVAQFDPRIDCTFTTEEIEALPPLMRDYVYTYTSWNKEKGLWLFYGDNNRFCNHSDHPTLWAPDGAFGKEIAACDLAIGDELTSDYRQISDNSMVEDYVI